MTACLTAQSFSDFLRFGVGSQFVNLGVKTYLAGTPIKPEPSNMAIIIPDNAVSLTRGFSYDEAWTIASTGTVWDADYGEWRHNATNGDFHLIGVSPDLDQPFIRAWADLFIPYNAPYQDGNYRLVAVDARDVANYGPGDLRRFRQGEWVTLWCDLEVPSKIKEIKIILGLGGNNVDGFRVRNLDFELQS